MRRLVLLSALLLTGCHQASPIVPSLSTLVVAPVAIQFHDMTTQAFLAGQLTVIAPYGTFEIDVPAGEQRIKLPVDTLITLIATVDGYTPIRVERTLHAGGIWSFSLHR